MEGRSRRDFLKNLTAVATGITGLVFGPESRRLESTRSETIPTDGLERREYETPESIEHFRDLRGGVLVIAANENEHQYVTSTLRQYRNKDGAGRRLHELKRTRDYTRVLSRVWNDGRGHETPTHTEDVPIIVVQPEALVEGSLAHRLRGETFRFIQLRGHTSDMRQLFLAAQPFFGRHTLLSLGGCNGTQFIPEFYQKNRPIIADSDTGMGPVNTHLLVNIIDNIGATNSWEELYRTLRSRTGHWDEQGIIMPGDPSYQYFVEQGR